MAATIFLLGFGSSILILTLFDLVKTTLVLSPYGGPLTARVARGIRFIFVRLGSRRHSFVGPGVLLAVLLTWLLFSWLGWTLLFSAVQGSVVEAQSGRPANLVARIYFVGYSLFTLGIGDYRPKGAFWQFATVLCAAQGFAVITLSITYIVPIVSAVTQKRQLAVLISQLGASPQAILIRAWNGQDFGWLEPQLTNLLPRLTELQLQHDTYPVLHYFNDTKREQAIVLSLAALDDAVTLLSFAVHKEDRPDANVLRSVREAMGAYLETLEAVHIQAAGVPPLPLLTQLREAGIPLVAEAVFFSRAEPLQHRRRLLLALLEHDGWSWREGEPSIDE